MPVGLTHKRRKKICNLIVDNFLSKEDACRLCGLTDGEYEIRSKEGYFQNELLKAEAKRDSKLIERIAEGGKKGEAAQWLLQRLSPEKFAKPSVAERVGDKKLPPPTGNLQSDFTYSIWLGIKYNSDEVEQFDTEENYEKYIEEQKEKDKMGDDEIDIFNDEDEISELNFDTEEEEKEDRALLKKRRVRIKNRV